MSIRLYDTARQAVVPFEPDHDVNAVLTDQCTDFVDQSGKPAGKTRRVCSRAAGKG